MLGYYTKKDKIFTIVETNNRTAFPWDFPQGGQTSKKEATKAQMARVNCYRGISIRMASSFGKKRGRQQIPGVFKEDDKGNEVGDQVVTRQSRRMKERSDSVTETMLQGMYV